MTPAAPRIAFLRPQSKFDMALAKRLAGILIADLQILEAGLAPSDSIVARKRICGADLLNAGCQ